MRFSFNRQGFVEKVKASAKDAVKEGAQIFEDAIKDALSGPSPSSPGSPPGMDTGNLKDSVHTVETSDDTDNPIATVGTDCIYAHIHEYGGTIRAINGPYLHFKTSDGKWVKISQVTMPPRPVWRPTYDKLKEAIQQHIVHKLCNG